MDLAEAGGGDEVQGLAPLGVGLAGEAGDDVGGEVDVGDAGAGLAGEVGELLGPAAARHAPQDAVGAALQGQVQVGHEAGIGEEVPEAIGQFPGFQGAEAQARHVRLGEDGADQVVQAQSQVAAPATQVDAREHGLADTRRRGAVDLLDHLRDGAAAFLAPRQGDDAEGAAVAAAVLDLDEGALAAAGEGDWPRPPWR